MPTSRVTTASVAKATVTEGSNVTPLRGEPESGPEAAPEAALTIECDCCTLRNTDACDDCVVSYVLGREPDDAVVIDADEARAMRMLERAGLLPTLRFSTQTG